MNWQFEPYFSVLLVLIGAFRALELGDASHLWPPLGWVVHIVRPRRCKRRHGQ